MTEIDYGEFFYLKLYLLALLAVLHFLRVEQNVCALVKQFLCDALCVGKSMIKVLE